MTATERIESFAKQISDLVRAGQWDRRRYSQFASQVRWLERQAVDCRREAESIRQWLVKGPLDQRDRIASRMRYDAEEALKHAAEEANALCRQASAAWREYSEARRLHRSYVHLRKRALESDRLAKEEAPRIRLEAEKRRAEAEARAVGLEAEASKLREQLADRAKWEAEIGRLQAETIDMDAVANGLRLILHVHRQGSDGRWLGRLVKAEPWRHAG